ncbi:hypothetical protein P6709_19960, partial [Jeotgalibacillus sp. ET6]|uniref:hypothetical protein n=1 Tax=Jeotgalibacillus sp. ET6 TaxID=3037260 RepID=UPI0024189733
VFSLLCYIHKHNGGNPYYICIGFNQYRRNDRKVEAFLTLEPAIKHLHLKNIASRDQLNVSQY